MKIALFLFLLNPPSQSAAFAPSYYRLVSTPRLVTSPALLFASSIEISDNTTTDYSINNTTSNAVALPSLSSRRQRARAAAILLLSTTIVATATAAVTRVLYRQYRRTTIMAPSRLATTTASALCCCLAAVAWIAYHEGRRRGGLELKDRDQSSSVDDKVVVTTNGDAAAQSTTNNAHDGESLTTKSSNKSANNNTASPPSSKSSPTSVTPTSSLLPIHPIGTLRSIYRLCVGTPRQGMLAPHSRGIVTFEETIMSKDSILELQHYSHVFVVFVFHLNSNGKVLEDRFGDMKKKKNDYSNGGSVGDDDDETSGGGVNGKKKKKTNNQQRQFPSKIAPPSLGGKKVGVFSTRTPHRPNPIGFSLCRLDKVIVHTDKKAKKRAKQNNEATFSLLLSGLDIVDGTPILDIKPYVPHYDCVGYNSNDNNVPLVTSLTPAAAAVNDDDDDDTAFPTNETVQDVSQETIDSSSSSKVNNDSDDTDDMVRVPHWVDSGLQKRRKVTFLPAANRFLNDLSIIQSTERQSTTPSSSSSSSQQQPSLNQLEFYGPHSPWNDSPEQATENVKQCILELLGVDVRSAWQTKKARKGKFQAERSSRLKEWKQGGNSDGSNGVGGGGGVSSLDDNDDKKNGGTKSNSGTSSSRLCTQQIDNLLVQYTIEEPGSDLYAKGTTTTTTATTAGSEKEEGPVAVVDERSMGSGAEDIVVVHSISLIK
ncbi:hypothetical protein ACHAXR_013110 [Thalassiosira sp. AJA248-18]